MKLLQRCFLMFFWMFFFRLLVILGARRLHFGFNFEVILSVLDLWKNLQNCATVINFRGLAVSRYSLFASLDCWCVLIVRFFMKFVICRWFEAPIFRYVGANRYKKVWKQIQHIIKNGSPGNEVKTVMEEGGSLKQKNTRHQNIRNQDIASNTPCVPKGTVADE